MRRAAPPNPRCAGTAPLAALVASVGLVACGGKATDSGGSQPAAQGGGQIVRVQAAAKPTQFGELRFRQRRLAARAGRVTFRFTNPASLGHDFAVRRNGRKLGKTPVISNGRGARLTLKLEAGRYIFYCSVPGHEASGMKGALVVTRR